MSMVDGIIRIDIRMRNLPCDNVHECIIWMRGILQWANANIKCVAQDLVVSLVCLDSTLKLFLMTSVLDILFRVAQRRELDHLGVLVPRTVPSDTLWHNRAYYSSFTATTRHLGVALQHVAVHTLGARYSVYVKVGSL